MDEGVTYAMAILANIRIGGSYQIASEAAGITYTTFKEWVARGNGTDARDDRDGRFAIFAADVEKARSEAKMRAVASIREAFQGVMEETTVTTRKPIRMEDGTIHYMEETKVTRGRKMYWQAGAWLLERTSTADFGRARVWKDLLPPDVPVESVPVEAAKVLDDAWAGYLQGRADAQAEVAEDT